MIEKLKINSIHDGLPLDILIATCNNPKAIVQIVHGMCEYKERYLDFINFFELFSSFQSTVDKNNGIKQAWNGNG